MKELADLFWTFCRIGGLTFGGGYAMLPMIQREVVDKRGWATEQEVMDYYAVGQCTPGIIAVNTATFIGYKQKGLVGGIVATLGVVFPSLVIITAISAMLQTFAGNQIVQHAFAGIRVAVAALVVDAVVKLWKKGVVDAVSVVIYILAFAATAIFKLSPIYSIIIAATVGIAVKKVKAGGAK